MTWAEDLASLKERARDIQDLGHAQELGLQAEVAAGHAEHGEQEGQDAVHGALGEHHGGRPAHGHEAEDDEEVLADERQRVFHGSPPYSSSATEYLDTGLSSNMFWNRPSMPREKSSRL